MIIRDINAAIAVLKDETEIALDLETSGFSPYSDKIAVVAMKGRNTKTCVLHVRGTLPFDLLQFFRHSHAQFITHNGTGFDLLFLRTFGIKVQSHYDTLIGEQVLAVQGRRDVKKSLDASIKRRLKRAVKEASPDHSRWMDPELSDQQLSYVTADIAALHELMDIQIDIAHSRNLATALANEQLLSPIIVEISHNGLALSARHMMILQLTALSEAKEAAERIQTIFGDFNVNSPPQVKNALRLAGASVVLDTKKTTLLRMKDRFPLAGDILKVRQAKRKSNAYDADWLEKYVHYGRVHTRYWQVGTDTTRFTSTDPNLQQIPRDMRSMIGNEEGLKVVSCDYAQIEIRLAAHLSKDRDLAAALESEDFHRDMAQTMFGKDNISHEERRDGKAGTFTWLFAGGGQGVVSAGAQAGVDIPLAQANQMVQALRRRFKATNRFHDNCRAKCQRAQVLTLNLAWGHQRQLVGANNISPQKVVNTLIQSRAAIGLKNALFELSTAGVLDYVGGLVHDEIVATSVPEKHAQEVSNIIKQCMITGMEKVCDTVPIIVDQDITDYWIP